MLDVNGFPVIHILILHMYLFYFYLEIILPHPRQQLYAGIAEVDLFYKYAFIVIIGMPV